MGETSITALAVAALVVFATLLFGAWDAAWNAVAYVTGDPSWRSESVRDDDMIHGFTMRHNIVARGNYSASVKAEFEVTNTSDTDIAFVRIICTFSDTDEWGDSSDHRSVYEFGNLDSVIIPAHSRRLLTASSNEIKISNRMSALPEVGDVDCSASPSSPW